VVSKEGKVKEKGLRAHVACDHKQVLKEALVGWMVKRRKLLATLEFEINFHFVNFLSSPLGINLTMHEFSCVISSMCKGIRGGE